MSYEILYKCVDIKDREDPYFPTCLSQFIVVSGQSLFQQLRAQGGHPPWRGRPSISGCISPTPTISPGQVRPPFHWSGTSFGCGSKRKEPEKTQQTWEECANRQWPWPWKSIPCPLPHQHYNETTLNKTTLFTGLLYWGLWFIKYRTIQDVIF